MVDKSALSHPSSPILDLNGKPRISVETHGKIDPGCEGWSSSGATLSGHSHHPAGATNLGISRLFFVVGPGSSVRAGCVIRGERHIGLILCFWCNVLNTLRSWS
ncbi:hypothetical protein VIN7_7304 [Saccharomyces cerevisiae x Saccharomyces kudriavzevii VIN7]|uniref:Uncharacterized protein n=1 Tax=Saccharomyces cerevisiae x Saccharomyces kudriavzevii (strain VIN7) TaxID=1095631 RepID=H0GV83_SACCK|nr:hypothetical protein VIN7_7304 [Saccharomyces cerevisiae x Saccharomyces kudriavzevii VIN7]